MSDAADIVLILDHSGSVSNQEVAWLANLVPHLEAKLLDQGFSSVQFGLVAYADGLPEHGFSYYFDGQLMATGTVVAEFLENLNRNTGAAEDGWDGIEHAFTEYQFRDGAPVHFILYTDDDRDVLTPMLTYEGLVSGLGSRNVALTVIGSASFSPDNMGDTVFGVLPSDNPIHQSIEYNNAAGAIRPNTTFNEATDTINAGGNTLITYIELAWETGGSIWNQNISGINPLGSAIEIAFTNAVANSVAGLLVDQVMDGRVKLPVTVVQAIDFGGVPTAQFPDSPPPSLSGQPISTTTPVRTISGSIPAGTEGVFSTAHVMNNGVDLDLSFNVDNDNYIVELFFVEFDPDAFFDIRIFDVVLEGTELLQNYKIYDDVITTQEIPPGADGKLAVALARDHAGLVKTFKVTVTDGQLDVELNDVGGSEGPVLAALRISKEVQLPNLPGDYNLNGVVDAPDYVIWRKTFGMNVTPFSGADGNGDGAIDQLDYDVWKANFGETLSPGSGAAVASQSPMTSAGLEDLRIESDDQSNARSVFDISIRDLDVKPRLSERAAVHTSSRIASFGSRDLIALLHARDYGVTYSNEEELFRASNGDESTDVDSPTSIQFESIIDRVISSWRRPLVSVV